MSLARTCPRCAAPLPDDAPEGAVCAACEAAAQKTRIDAGFTASAEAPGAVETIGDYEIIDKLGQGGMGAVYRARQRSLDRVVALKVLPNQFGDDPEFISRFQREARVAASLQHANLVRVYATGQADGSHFIAMELIDGENLHQRLRRERLPVPEALRICADVARGLQCGWDRAQLVHRDIKPSNIYLSHGGEVKVGDLGLAKSVTGVTSGLTQTGTMMGTPYYMSPEQARGDKTLDFRADIYSLGCTLYEMLTGQPPYGGTDPLSIVHQHIHAPLPAILKALPQCPMPLVRIVGRMLKKQKHERYPNYAELISELEWVREQIEQGTVGRAPGAARRETTVAVGQAPRLPVAGTPPPTPASGALALQKPKLGLWLAIAAGVIVLGTLAFVLTRPAKQKAGARISSPAATPARMDTPTAGAKPGEQGGLALPAGAWQPMVTDPKTALTNPNSAYNDGWYRNPLATIIGPIRDAAMRARFRWVEGGAALFQMRSTASGNRIEFYDAAVSRTDIAVHRSILLDRVWADGEARTLATWKFPKPLAPGDEFDLAMMAVGTDLAVWFNGQRVIAVSDEVIKEGKLIAGTKNTAVEVKSMMWRDLSVIAHPPTPAPAVAATGASRLEPNGQPGELFALEGHTAAVRVIAFMPGRNDRAVSASWDKTVRIWDLAARKELRRFEHSNFVNAVAPTPIGNYVIAGDSNGNLILWDLGNGRLTAKTQLPPGGGTAQSIAISPTRGYGVVGTDKGEAYRFEVIGLNKLTRIAEPVGGGFVQVAYFPDGDHALIGVNASGDKPSRLCKVRVSDMQVVTDYPPHDGAPIGACDVSADGKFVAAALGKHGVRIWDAATGRVFRDIGASASYQTDLRFVGDGATLVTGTHTGTLRTWDRSTGTERRKEQSAAGWVTTHIATSADGRFALTAGGYRVISKKEDDGHYTLHLWRLP